MSQYDRPLLALNTIWPARDLNLKPPAPDTNSDSSLNTRLRIELQTNFEVSFNIFEL